MSTEMRKVQVFKNNMWNDINFYKLKNGDKFRLFEPDGNIVKDKNNNTEFNAISDPYINEEYNVLAIDVAETSELV